MLIGEEFREENLQVEEYDGMTDFEREKAVERAKALNHFRKAQAMVAALDKVPPPPGHSVCGSLPTTDTPK